MPPSVARDADAPIVTDAGPSAPASGGASRYSSEFGELIDGLTANSQTEGTADSETPGGRPAPALPTGSDITALPALAQAATVAGAPAAPDDGDETGGGEDTGGGGEDTGGGGEDTGGDDSVIDPAGPGADQSLFTTHPDVVDINAVDIGGYLDGTQYDASNGDDIVILPTSLLEAQEAGYAPGTLFIAGNGNDKVTGGGLPDLVDGGNGNDVLFGGASGDSLHGGNSNDTLDGGDGDDLLDGGAGNDLLIGGQGDDSLLGGANNDTLTGGTGDDVLSGGTGHDAFTYSLSTNEGKDLILDFKTGSGGDRLEISDLLDVNGDSVIDLADLDAGGATVSGSADAIVISFDSGTSITLDGLNGIGVDSFVDLVANAKVNVDIL